MNTCLWMENDDLPLHFLSRSQHHHEEASPSSTRIQTTQPMIGTQWLRMGITDTHACWRSIFDTLLPCDTDDDNCNRDTTGLCVTVGAAIDWKSRRWKLTAQLTTELLNWHMFDPSNGMSGIMVVWEELRAWHVLASVFCLLFDFCTVFNSLVFYRHDHALEEC